MKIVVSACLMGESCKYNGLDNYHRELVEACERTGAGSVEKVGVEPDSKRVGPASWNLEYG